MIFHISRFELVKLMKSSIYLVVMLLPLLYGAVVLAHYKWNFDQSILDHKQLSYEGTIYPDKNPYFHFSAQVVSGLFLIITPLQTILGFGISRQLDLYRGGWMLTHSLGIKFWILRTISFASNSCLMAFSWFMVLLCLVVCLWFLPDILTQLEFGHVFNPWKQLSILFLCCMLISLPMLILHYWISTAFRRMSISLVLVILFLLITYSVYHATPYYLLSKFMSQGLYTIRENYLLGHQKPIISSQLFSWQEITSVVIISALCLIHVAFKGKRV